MVEAVTRRLFQTLHSVVNALVEFTHPYVPLIGILVEIVLESVMLEQLLVIRRIVGVGIERLKLESLHEAPPPFVPVTEIDGTVHRLHSLAAEPLAGRIEKHVGDLLRINAFEESTATGRLFLLCGLVGIVKGGNTSHHIALPAAGNPTDGLSALEHPVLCGVEHGPDIVVQGLYPVAVTAVESLGHGEELPLLPFGHDLFEHIFSHTLSVLASKDTKSSGCKNEYHSFLPKRSI